MTDYSNYTIKDIWEKRNINALKINSPDSDLTDRGNGIFIQTSDGSQLYDLRLESERIYLGHVHPIWVKINASVNKSLESITKVTAKPACKELSNFNPTEDIALLIKPSNLIEDLDQVKDILTKLDTKHTIVEEDLFLLTSERMFKISKAKRGIYSSLLNIYFELGKTSEIPSVNFEQSYSHFSWNYLDTFIFSEDTGKASRDEHYLKEFCDKRSLKLQGRTILFNQDLVAKLRAFGVLSSKIGKNTALSYPIACTEREILDSLEVLETVLKEM